MAALAGRTSEPTLNAWHVQPLRRSTSSITRTFSGSLGMPLLDRVWVVVRAVLPGLSGVWGCGGVDGGPAQEADSKGWSRASTCKAAQGGKRGSKMGRQRSAESCAVGWGVQRLASVAGERAGSRCRAGAGSMWQRGVDSKWWRGAFASGAGPGLAEGTGLERCKQTCVLHPEPSATLSSCLPVRGRGAVRCCWLHAPHKRGPSLFRPTPCVRTLDACPARALMLGGCAHAPRGVGLAVLVAGLGVLGRA